MMHKVGLDHELSDGVQRTAADIVAGNCRHRIVRQVREAPDLHKASMRLRQIGGRDFVLFPSAGRATEGNGTDCCKVGWHIQPAKHRS